MSSDGGQGFGRSDSSPRSAGAIAVLRSGLWMIGALRHAVPEEVVAAGGSGVAPHRRGSRRRGTMAGFAAVVLFAGLLGGVRPAHADACSPNPVVCENAMQGTPDTVWDIDGVGAAGMQGFTTDISVNLGGTIGFKIQSQGAFTIDIYRLGWYNGDGARKITTLPGTFPAQNQTAQCVTDNSTEITDCGTWALTTIWTVPTNLVSGVYFALLTDAGNSSAKSQIP